MRSHLLPVPFLAGNVQQTYGGADDAGLGTAVALETLADLLDYLGGIAPERVRLSPAPGTATEEDVLHVHDHAGRLCELVEGVLVEKAMGFRESFLAAALIIILGNFVRPRNLGLVTGPDGMVRLAAGLVRIPDVAFISWTVSPTVGAYDANPCFSPESGRGSAQRWEHSPRNGTEVP